MKKILLVICLALMLCGCGKETKEDILKNFTNTIENSKAYKLEGNMEISNDEETFVYSLESYFLKDGYYKVVLVNQTNNHKQIILKNKEDIYVITPALNKSFKFQSEWPNNSSQAYLLGNLVNDIKNDIKSEVAENDNGYVIKSGVNYPNNEELTYQKIYLNKDKNVEKVEVFNNTDIVKIKVIFNSIDLKARLSEKDFKLNDYIKEENKENINNKVDTNSGDETCNENTSNEDCKTENNVNQEQSENIGENSESNSEKTSNIENIIYPLYIPSNTYLTSSETLETATGNRVILTFSGEKNFVLIEETAIKADQMEIVPVYGEPLLLSETIGALSANSLSWDSNSISYYLASTELTVGEMRTIANSLGNTTLVNAEK